MCKKKKFFFFWILNTERIQTKYLKETKDQVKPTKLE